MYGCGGCSSARFNNGCISSTAAAAEATAAAGFPAAGADEDDDDEDDDDEGGQAFSAFSVFTALFLRSSSDVVDDDLGLEQTLVFVLWEPCEVPALGESIPESLGESNLRTLCFVTVAAAVPVAAFVTVDSSPDGAAATRLRDTVVTVAADEEAAFAAAAAAAADAA